MKIKRDFILDPSLVLYLPLWKHDGASFMSDDPYGHLATVTGALWTPQGRTFDAVDDVISSPSASTTALDFTTGLFSVTWWVKPASLPAVGRIITRAAFNNNGWGLYSAGADIVVSFAPSGLDKTIGSSVLTQDIWQMFTFVRTGTATGVLYKNGSSEGSIATLADITTSNGNFEIGYTISTGHAALPGIWGEVLINSRDLTPAEIQRNYLVTKWRYV